MVLAANPKIPEAYLVLYILKTILCQDDVAEAYKLCTLCTVKSSTCEPKGVEANLGQLSDTMFKQVGFCLQVEVRVEACLRIQGQHE
jgi:hypothetical protein